MLPEFASYSTTTNKVVIGQVFNEGLTTIQVEGLDAIATTIYRKEDPLKKGIRKIYGGNRERERKIENCITEKYIS